MRKISLLIVTIVLAFSMVACGDKGNSKKDTTISAETTVGDADTTDNKDSKDKKENDETKSTSSKSDKDKQSKEENTGDIEKLTKDDTTKETENITTENDVTQEEITDVNNDEGVNTEDEEKVVKAKVDEQYIEKESMEKKKNEEIVGTTWKSSSIIYNGNTYTIDEFAALSGKTADSMKVSVTYRENDTCVLKFENAEMINGIYEVSGDNIIVSQIGMGDMTLEGKVIDGKKEYTVDYLGDGSMIVCLTQA